MSPKRHSARWLKLHLCATHRLIDPYVSFDSRYICLNDLMVMVIMSGIIILIIRKHTISHYDELHYSDVIISAMASQITAGQRKHQSSASLAFVRGIHRWPVNSPHKGQVTRKMFAFDDVTMTLPKPKHLFKSKATSSTNGGHRYDRLIPNPINYLGTLSLRWRQNGSDSVSNHQPHDCLLNRLFRRRSKKTSKLRVTGLCARNSPGTGEFPAQMASYAENVSIWWRHHAM